MYSSLPDIELWNAFTAGDKEAFSTLFRRFYPLLFQYGNKIAADEALLEDTIQELFLELWQKKNSQPVLSVKAYLLQALKFKLYKTFRNKKHTVTGEEAENSVFELSQETAMINRQETEGNSKMIYAALEQLSPRQREVIYLKIYKGLTYEEVSAVMGINYQVVRNLLCNALKSLKKLCTLLLLPAIILIA